MVKNELFTMKVNDARTFRRMLKEVKEHIRADSMESAIITMVRFLYPSIAIKYYPVKITPIIWGDDSEKRVEKRDTSR